MIYLHDCSHDTMATKRLRKEGMRDPQPCMAHVWINILAYTGIYTYIQPCVYPMEYPYTFVQRYILAEFDPKYDITHDYMTFCRGILELKFLL